MTRLRARLARQPPGYHLTIGRILAIYAGIMAAVLLAALDLTIVATALPQIVSDLGGIESYPWIVTAYTLAMTVTIPMYGKLGDVYGRRPLFLVSIAIFVGGSMLCGLAQSMTQLVVFRAVQGVGAGGLFPLALATVALIVPPADRGRYQGLIAGMFGASAVAGPAIGGVLTDQASWRWCFYVNVPVGALALAVILVTMPRVAARREHAIDWLGAGVLAAATTSLLLAIGGTAPAVTLPLAAGLLAAFVLVERRAVEPILPFGLLRSRVVAAGSAAVALCAMAMFGTVAYVPLFVQGAMGTTATESGAVLTPFILGAVVMSVVSGQWVARTGRYRVNALLGPVLLVAGLLLIARLGPDTSRAEAAASTALAGAGLGSMMQIFVLVVQNAIPLRVMGAATALTQFGRALGGSVGVALMGVIVNLGLPPGVEVADRLHGLPLALRDELAQAMRPAFYAAAAIGAAVFVVAALGVREVPLQRGFEEAVETGGAVGSQTAARVRSTR